MKNVGRVLLEAPFVDTGDTKTTPDLDESIEPLWDGDETEGGDVQYQKVEYEYRQELNKWYRDEHDLSLEDAFVATRVVQQDNATLWTSSFICPIFGDRIEAGVLPGMETCTEIDGRFYYSKKKSAMQAAAMQAQIRHQLRFREKLARKELAAWYGQKHGVTVSKDLFDTRMESIKGRRVGGNWWTASFVCPVSGEEYFAATLRDVDGARQDSANRCTWYRKKADAIAAVSSRVLDVKRFQENGMSESRYCEEDPAMFRSESIEANLEVDTEEESSVLEGMVKANVAYRALCTWYEKTHSVSLAKESFVSTVTNLEEPVENCKVWWTASFLCPISGVRYDSGTMTTCSKQEVIGNWESGIWYKLEGDAVVAAASRAMDCIQYEESGVKAPRYCEEDPSPSCEIEAVDKIEGRASTQNPDNLASASEADERDAIQYAIPAARATLDLIAATWADLAPIQGSQQMLMPKAQSLTAERQQAVKRAWSWVDQHRPEAQDQNRKEQVVFDLDHHSISLKVGNIMLDSLAQVNSRLPVEKFETGIEAAAAAIVEVLWSSKSAKPNGDTYASYLRCLEGEDPMSTALRAQAIFNAMKAGIEFDGRVLPCPNTAVSNAVIQLWARLGGTSGRFELEDDAAMDRDSFLSVLSCMAYPAAVPGEVGGFDAEFAQDCIERMRREYINTGDKSLKADIQVYNAGLRWSGGLMSTSSRPYAHPLHWDEYHKIFEHGFQTLNEDDPLFVEAKAMEDWSKMMESPTSMITPDIETYESVIQAWVRTGTEEGVRNAALLAERLLESSTSPRPRQQTFHPVISAWLYVGSPEKIAALVRRLDAAQDLAVDCRLRTSQLKAYLSQQRQISQSIRAEKLSDYAGGGNLSLNAANLCARGLQELIDSCMRERDFFLEPAAFIVTLQAWHNAILMHAGGGDDNRREFPISEVLNVVEQFEGLIATLSGMSGDSLKTHQARHLVSAAPKVYAGVILCLNDYGKLDSGDPLHGVVERGIHKSQEFRAILSQMAIRNEHDASNSILAVSADDVCDQLLYDDLISYPTLPLLDPAFVGTRMKSLSQFFHPGQGISARVGKDTELIRLCVKAIQNFLEEKAGVARRDSAESKSPIDLLENLSSTPVYRNNGLLGRLVRGLKTDDESAGLQSSSTIHASRRKTIRRPRRGARQESRQWQARVPSKQAAV